MIWVAGEPIHRRAPHQASAAT